MVPNPLCFVSAVPLFEITEGFNLLQIGSFGNESAAREVKEKWRKKGGLVMLTSGGYS